MDQDQLTIPWADVPSLELSKAGALELRVRGGVRVNWHRRLLTRLLRKDRETGSVIPLRALSVSQHVLAAEARSQLEEYERRELLRM